MKKYAALLIVIGLALSLTGCDACKENPFTKLGDSVATMGKSGIDKDKVLADRAASRAGKCAEAKGGEMKKKLGF